MAGIDLVTGGNDKWNVILAALLSAFLSPYGLHPLHLTCHPSVHPSIHPWLGARHWRYDMNQIQCLCPRSSREGQGKWWQLWCQRLKKNFLQKTQCSDCHIPWISWKQGHQGCPTKVSLYWILIFTISVWRTLSLTICLYQYANELKCSTVRLRPLVAPRNAQLFSFSL